jgi:3-dehydroquinate dehydratase
MAFTPTEKAREARREYGQRQHVYTQRVNEGKMKQGDAQLRLDLMKEIAEDYERLAREQEQDLFGTINERGPK